MHTRPIDMDERFVNAGINNFVFSVMELTFTANTLNLFRLVRNIRFGIFTSIKSPL